VGRSMNLKDPEADAFGMIMVFMDDIPSGMGALWQAGSAGSTAVAL